MSFYNCLYCAPHNTLHRNDRIPESFQSASDLSATHTASKSLLKASEIFPELQDALNSTLSLNYLPNDRESTDNQIVKLCALTLLATPFDREQAALWKADDAASSHVLNCLRFSPLPILFYACVPNIAFVALASRVSLAGQVGIQTGVSCLFNFAFGIYSFVVTGTLPENETRANLPVLHEHRLIERNFTNLAARLLELHHSSRNGERELAALLAMEIKIDQLRDTYLRASHLDPQHDRTSSLAAAIKFIQSGDREVFSGHLDLKIYQRQLCQETEPRQLLLSRTPPPLQLRM